MQPAKQLSLRNKNWKRNLKTFISLIKQKPIKFTIILFGSRARGNYSALSDTDLLIITEKTNITLLEELTSLAYKADLIAPEIHLFEKNWALKHFEENTILLDAVYEGKVLLDNLKIIKTLKSKLKSLLSSGWYKNEKGWHKKLK